VVEGASVWLAQNFEPRPCTPDKDKALQWALKAALPRAYLHLPPKYPVNKGVATKKCRPAFERCTVPGHKYTGTLAYARVALREPKAAEPAVAASDPHGPAAFDPAVGAAFGAGAAAFGAQARKAQALEEAVEAARKAQALEEAARKQAVDDLDDAALLEVAEAAFGEEEHPLGTFDLLADVEPVPVA
jgi:hypothetical protein